MHAAAALRHSTPHARQCHLHKWSDIDGYGFDLYEILKKPGPRIGAVVKGSPAEAGHCKQDDYVIEVNGENVEKLRHAEVVSRIGHKPTQVQMLLVDQEAKAYFKAHSVRIHSGMDSVEAVHCPERPSVVSGRLCRALQKHVSTLLDMTWGNRHSWRAHVLLLLPVVGEQA